MICFLPFTDLSFFRGCRIGWFPLMLELTVDGLCDYSVQKEERGDEETESCDSDGFVLADRLTGG